MFIIFVIWLWDIICHINDEIIYTNDVIYYQGNYVRQRYCKITKNKSDQVFMNYNSFETNKITEIVLKFIHKRSIINPVPLCKLAHNSVVKELRTSIMLVRRLILSLYRMTSKKRTTRADSHHHIDLKTTWVKLREVIQCTRSVFTELVEEQTLKTINWEAS